MIYILSCFQMPKNAASASQSHAMQDVSRDRTGSSCNFVPEKSLSICLKKGNDWYDKVVTKNIQKWPGFKEVTLDSKNQVPPILRVSRKPTPGTWEASKSDVNPCRDAKEIGSWNVDQNLQ